MTLARAALTGPLAALALGVIAHAQVLAPPVPPGAAVRPYVKVPSGRIALTHVRVIDGTFT